MTYDERLVAYREQQAEDYRTRAQRHTDALSAWPLAVRCPLEGNQAAGRIDSGASGVKYKCRSCGVEFRITAAQIRKAKVAKAAEAIKRLIEKR